MRLEVAPDLLVEVVYHERDLAVGGDRRAHVDAETLAGDGTVGVRAIGAQVLPA